MKKNFYEAELHTENTTFGGVIYPSDFEPECKKEHKKNGSDIARRIISDWSFDRQCGQNIEIRGRKISDSHVYGSSIKNYR